ncbi:hypothetical protein T492DRAFT_842918 [Pavlovales sp. CCMP2436]|nr:hypothetical protein T492DRAFT_842918 [Pavlovales sp. CCMP2436]
MLTPRASLLATLAAFSANGAYADLSSTPVPLLKMVATKSDIAAFDKVVQCTLKHPRAIYAEWGCGGSTTRVLASTRADVYSLDSSADWLRNVDMAVSSAYPGRFHPRHVDLGPLGAWGWPNGTLTRKDGARYFTGLDAQIPNADLILIDGRWRTACAIRAALLARPGTIIIIHDFWNRVKTAYANVLNTGVLRVVDTNELRSAKWQCGDLVPSNNPAIAELMAFTRSKRPVGEEMSKPASARTVLGIFVVGSNRNVTHLDLLARSEAMRPKR